MITIMKLFGTFCSVTMIAFTGFMPTRVRGSVTTVVGTTSQEANQPILNLGSAASGRNQSEIVPNIPAAGEFASAKVDNTTNKSLQQKMSSYKQQEKKSPRIGSSSFQAGIGFLGLSYGDNGILNDVYQVPPDPTCAASTTTLVAAVNDAIEIRTKFGGVLATFGFKTFFANLGPIGFLYDPKVIYDEYEDKFFIALLQQASPGTAGLSGNDYTTGVSRILLAVSKSGSPAAGSDFYVTYINSLEYSASLGDYVATDSLGLAVSSEAIYITSVLFSFQESIPYGSRVWIVDKYNFYSGGQSNYRKADPYKGNYILFTTPARVYGGAIGSNIGTYLVAYDGFANSAGSNFVYVTTVTNPKGTPTFTSTFVNLGVIDDTSTRLPGAPQLGTSDTIDVGDRQVFDVVWRSNSLWLTTTILPLSGPNFYETTAYWVKINTNTFTVQDQGEIGGEDIDFGAYTSFASVAVNSAGVAAFGFAAFGPNIYPGAYVVGRSPSDPPSTVSSAFVVAEGVDSYYRTFSGTRNRWGDYSGIAVDPVDGSFWVYNEFADSRGYVDDYGDDGVWATAWLNFYRASIPTPPPTPRPTPRPTPPPTILRAPPTIRPTVSRPTAPIAPAPPTFSFPTSAPCFSETNTVDVKGKGLVAMKDLKIGDKVKDATGNMVSVYSFAHYHPDVRVKYLQMFVNGLDKPLEISKNHMMFINGTAVPASTVLPGDYVDLVDATTGTNSAAKIRKITFKVRNGAYAPFTTSGTITVSGVAASNYVTLQTNSSVLLLGQIQTSLTVHWLEHVFLAPHRLFCYMMGMDYCRKTETYNQDGISNWAEGPFHVFRWLVERNNGILMGAFVIPALIVGLVFYALEVGWMYVLLLVSVIGYLGIWKRKVTFKTKTL